LRDFFNSFLVPPHVSFVASVTRTSTRLVMVARMQYSANSVVPDITIHIDKS
jgi:hypothetical protein